MKPEQNTEHTPEIPFPCDVLINGKWRPCKSRDDFEMLKGVEDIRPWADNMVAGHYAKLGQGELAEKYRVACILISEQKARIDALHSDWAEWNAWCYAHVGTDNQPNLKALLVQAMSDKIELAATKETLKELTGVVAKRVYEGINQHQSEQLQVAKTEHVEHLRTISRLENELAKAGSWPEIYRRMDIARASLLNSAGEMVAGSEPEGYSELDEDAVRIADACLHDGMKAMHDTILNWIYDQMTPDQRASLDPKEQD